MRRWFLGLALVLGAALSASAQATATPPEPKLPLTRILFVFDASYSMHGRWESGTKMETAQRLMGRFLDSLAVLPNPNFQLALRAYGHQKPVPPQDCEDTKLEVPFAPNNAGKIKKRIQSLRPMGTTPIARSLLRSGNDFPACADCRNIIVLITDGIEACDEDPCAVSALLQKKGIILKPFVIGVGLDGSQKKAFDCVGTYFDAADERSFRQALSVVITQVLDNTTAQINLLDARGFPTETDVPITLHDRLSGKLIKSFVHTLNYKGNPDTLLLDPLMTYRMTVFTVPPVTVDSVFVAAGKHTPIGAKTPQGNLEVLMNRSSTFNVPKAVVRLQGQAQTLHVQPFNTKQKYLVGTYQVELLTLPRYYETVRIEPGKTTTLSLPAAGDVTVQLKTASAGALFVERQGGAWEWVVDLDPVQTRQQFALQPGSYKMVARARQAQSTLYSATVSFTVSSGASTLVKIP